MGKGCTVLSSITLADKIWSPQNGSREKVVLNMKRKHWLILFWILLLIYFLQAVIFGGGPLVFRILGLIIVVMWFFLTPIIGRSKKYGDSGEGS